MARTKATLLSLLLAASLLGCVAPQDGAVRSHVRVLTAEEVEAVEVLDEELRVVDTAAAWVHDVEVGAVLVSETGLLREVVAIEQAGDEHRIATRLASLDDALEEMDLEQHSGHVLGKADVIDLDLGVHLAVEDIPIHEDGPLTVRLHEASLDTWPVLDVETRMRRGEFREVDMAFDAEVEARLVVDLDVRTEDAISTSISRTLYESLPQHYVQWVGVVPIVESVQTRLIADITLEAEPGTEATVRIGGRANASFRAGGRYVEGEGIETLRVSKTLEIEPIGPELLVGDTNPDFVRVALRPEVEVRFYEVIGLTVGVDAYAQMSSPEDAPACRMDVGLAGDATVDFTAFGIHRARSTQLFDRSGEPSACSDVAETRH